MTLGDNIRAFGNKVSLPIENIRNINTSDSSSIFGETLTPKFEQLVGKGSRILQEFSKDYQAKRDERIRKAFEDRVSNPQFEDELIEDLKNIGKGFLKGIGSIFNRGAKKK